MPTVADHAYNHCLAVLGDADAAVVAAAIAVRQGGRPRTAVLGHARHEALLRPPAAPSEPGSTAELLEVARWLAATRPPEERALIDLADRHELDRAALGRVWAAAPAEVADRLSAVDETWSRELDPALLVWLGAGDCDGLGAVLEAGGSGGDGDGILDGRVAEVRSHVADCESCRDRVRAMVSVRTLLATAPFEPAPATVAGAGARRRRRRPAPVPARTVHHRRSRVWIAATAAALVVAVGLAGIVISMDRDDRVTTITAAPGGGSSLVVVPDRLSGAISSPISLRNLSVDTLSWTARAKDFLTVEPASGELAPGTRERVTVGLGRNAPEGEMRATVTFSGDDGSSAAVQVESTVERAPDIDARAQECAVTAAVEDESELGSVVLHWRSGGTESNVAMIEGDDAVWAGELPEAAVEIEWWVSATDRRGNHAATPVEHLLPFCGRT